MSNTERTMTDYIYLQAPTSDGDFVRAVQVDEAQWMAQEEPPANFPEAVVRAINAVISISSALKSDGVIDSLTADIRATDDGAAVWISNLQKEGSVELSPTESMILATYTAVPVANVTIEVSGITDNPGVLTVSKPVFDIPQVADYAVTVIVNNDISGDIVDYTQATQLVSTCYPYDWSIVGSLDEQTQTYVLRDGTTLPATDTPIRVENLVASKGTQGE